MASYPRDFIYSHGFWVTGGSPRLSAIFFKRARLRSLIGQLSLLHVPNMVLSKMNNREHRTKQPHEGYTFQPLMSFW